MADEADAHAGGPTVSPAAYAAIGSVLDRHTSDPVSRRHVREYLAGTDDPEQSYLDPQEGQALPPLFFLAAIRDVVHERDLLEGGQHAGLAVDGITGRSVEAGTEAVLHAPLHVGDTLTAERRLVSIEEKQGRSGPLAIVTTCASYRNQHDELVAEFTQTIIFR
jgi:hydroxyacyl-ACP dehydratase HTD2-like protein with hotdog domain